MNGIISAWGRILAGYTPALAIEITRECPLRCPGCYAYGDDHLGGEMTLREVRDFKGQELVDGVMALVERHKPLHVSIVGGEPLVRYRELEQIIPALSARGIHTQLVTSAVREIPKAFVDTAANHGRRFDRRAAARARRAPHAGDLRPHPQAHRRTSTITVHCTVTRQQVNRPGYLEEFLRFWSDRREVRKIWISLYTPQIGEISAERLTPADRRQVVSDLMALRLRYPKLEAPKGLIDVYANPPSSPDECVFARTTTSISADLTTRITPCQFGGAPDCNNCGCVASAGLAAVARHHVWGFIPVGSIFTGSVKVGERMRRLRPVEA